MKKKLYVIAVLVVLFTAIASYSLASIVSTWDSIHSMRGYILFNYNAGTEVSPDYYPVRFVLQIKPITSDGKATTVVEVQQNSGTNQSTAFDLTTQAGRTEFWGALPSFMQTPVKNAFIEAIDEDPSQ